MLSLLELLFPLALPFLTFAEGNGGEEGGGGGEDSDDGGGDKDSDEAEEEEEAEELSPDELKAKLAATNAALRRANSEAKDRRLKLKKFEEDEAARQKANMSELEKAQTERDEAVAERDRLLTARIDREMSYSIQLEAIKAGFKDPEDAQNLINLDEIEVDEETFEVKGVVEALKKLAKAKPYLLKDEDDGSDGHGTPRKDSKRKTKGKEVLSEKSLAVL